MFTIVLVMMLSACTKPNHELCADITLSPGDEIAESYEYKNGEKINVQKHTLQEVAEICFSPAGDSNSPRQNYKKGALALWNAGQTKDEIMKRVDNLRGIDITDYDDISIREDVMSELEIVELKKAGKINSLEEIIKFLNSNDDISRSMAQKLVWKVSYEMGNGEGKNKGLARKAIESWAKNKDRKVYEFASSDLEYYDKKEFERTYKIGKKLWEYFKTFKGNRDIPGQRESVYVNGDILKKCSAGNKYPGYFGWIEFKMPYVMGNYVENPEKMKLYMGVIDYGDSIEGMSRGEEYVDAIKNFLKTKGCAI